jgi:hypothetical protein
MVIFQSAFFVCCVDRVHTLAARSPAADVLGNSTAGTFMSGLRREVAGLNSPVCGFVKLSFTDSLIKLCTSCASLLTVMGCHLTRSVTTAQFFRTHTQFTDSALGTRVITAFPVSTSGCHPKWPKPNVPICTRHKRLLPSGWYLGSPSTQNALYAHLQRNTRAFLRVRFRVGSWALPNAEPSRIPWRLAFRTMFTTMRCGSPLSSSPVSRGAAPRVQRSASSRGGQCNLWSR